VVNPTENDITTKSQSSRGRFVALSDVSITFLSENSKKKASRNYKRVSSRKGRRRKRTKRKHR